MNSADGGVVAIIPARGGSKRLPRKNVLPLSGKPLLAWTVEAAIASGRFRDVVVSSDDPDVLAVAEPYGVLMHSRSAALSSDTASTSDAMGSILDWLEQTGRSYETCVLLQPTSPLRSAEDIASALELYRQGARQTVISVSDVGVPSGWLGTIDSMGRMKGFSALSGAGEGPQPTYRLNGAIYVFDCLRFRDTGRYQTDINLAFVMPAERAIDIDTALDLAVCEFLLQNERSRWQGR